MLRRLALASAEGSGGAKLGGIRTVCEITRAAQILDAFAKSEAAAILSSAAAVGNELVVLHQERIAELNRFDRIVEAIRHQAEGRIQAVGMRRAAPSAAVI